MNFAGYDAHHVFPAEFADDFEALKINIHDPRYGAWWEMHDHRQKAKEYNRLWDEWLTDNSDAKIKDALEFAGQLADQYGFTFKGSLYSDTHSFNDCADYYARQ